MKRVIYFLVFLFLIGFSSAIPEIQFQKNNYQPQETIIGSIDDISDYSIIKKDDLHIYEQRREVFFEKDLMKINDSYYFYIIPTKEGSFSLKINNVVFSSGGGGDLEKNFSINKNLSVSNKTQTLTIRPGIYSGMNPSINIINSGEEVLNVTINNGALSFILPVGNSKKITENIPDGFSFLNVVSYDVFSVPIYKDFISNMPENNTINNTNETNNVTNDYVNCISLNQSFYTNYLIGDNNTFNVEILNKCDFPIENIEIISDSEYVTPALKIGRLNASEYGELIFNFDIQSSGATSANVNLSLDESVLASTKIIVFSFKNESSLEKFNQTYEIIQVQNEPSCEQLSGTLCTSTQTCSTDNYTPKLINGTVFTCCFDSCVELKAPTNWSNILIGLLGFALIGGIIYLLYKKSKKINKANPQDKFAEVDRKYQKNITGKEK